VSLYTTESSTFHTESFEFSQQSQLSQSQRSTSYLGGDKSFASQFSSNKNSNKSTISSLRERFSKMSKPSMKRQSSSSSSTSITLSKKRAKTIVVFDENYEEGQCRYFPQSPKTQQISQEEEDKDEENESSGNEDEDEDCIVMYDDEFSDNECLPVEMRPSISAKVNWEQIKAESKKKTKESSAKSYAQKFRAKIAPGDNESAEQELKKQLTKEMFKEVAISNFIFLFNY
jgi:hypothetical protein